jgi:phosphinothricin acetyltransferase
VDAASLTRLLGEVHDPVVIRDATADDLPHVLAIYNASIATTTTWSERPQTIEERQQWFRERRSCGDGVVVAVEGENVIGFAAYGPFRDNTLWPGYRFTVENTVHVRESHHGRGIGRLLMNALFRRAESAGVHAMVAAVDAENEASIAFHEAVGFEVVGRLPEIGWKFGRWLDLVLMHRIISTRQPNGAG